MQSFLLSHVTLFPYVASVSSDAPAMSTEQRLHPGYPGYTYQPSLTSYNTHHVFGMHEMDVQLCASGHFSADKLCCAALLHLSLMYLALMPLLHGRSQLRASSMQYAGLHQQQPDSWLRVDSKADSSNVVSLVNHHVALRSMRISTGRSCTRLQL